MKPVGVTVYGAGEFTGFHGPVTLGASSREPWDQFNFRLDPDNWNCRETGGGAIAPTVMLPEPPGSKLFGKLAINSE